MVTIQYINTIVQASVHTNAKMCDACIHTQFYTFQSITSTVKHTFKHITYTHIKCDLFL